METNQIFEEVKNVIVKLFGSDVGELTEDTRLREINGWDSLGHMSFIGELEEKFNIKFSFAEVISLTTVKSVVGCIEKHN